MEPDSTSQRQYADDVMMQHSERNSIAGYSAHLDAVTLSSIVYVMSDIASLSDTASIGS